MIDFKSERHQVYQQLIRYGKALHAREGGKGICAYSAVHRSGVSGNRIRSVHPRVRADLRLSCIPMKP